MLRYRIFLLVFIGGTLSGFAQCVTDSFIQEEYLRDAKILVLREILSNPDDPDYNNPEIPQERTTPYLEKLSAIYDEMENYPIIDSIFNRFKVHANAEYNDIQAPHRSMFLEVYTTADWLEDFKETGISGMEVLDNLIEEYQLLVNFSLPIHRMNRIYP